MKYRFSLRSLFLFSAITSILSAVIGYPIVQRSRELVIARELEEMGCWVEWKPDAEQWGADFFSQIGLQKAYWRIHGVEFPDGTQIERSNLLQLANLPSLRRLSISNAWLDDNALVPLGACQNLRELDASGNASVTDAGLTALAFGNLELLSVAGTAITYGGLRTLAKQNPRLDLDLLVSDKALRHLKHIGFHHSAQIPTRGSGAGRSITIRQKNDRQGWYEAAEHLQEFPGPVIAIMPDSDTHGKHWEVTIDFVIVSDAASTTIEPGVQHDEEVRNTYNGLAIIPPRGTRVWRVTSHSITAWFDHRMVVGSGSLDVPRDVQVVIVAPSSFAVSVDLQSLH